MGPRAERAREKTNLLEPETIPAAKKEAAVACLAGSELVIMSDTSPAAASTSVVKMLNIGKSDCATTLPEQHPISVSALQKCPKKQQNRSKNVKYFLGGHAPKSHYPLRSLHTHCSGSTYW